MKIQSTSSYQGSSKTSVKPSEFTMYYDEGVQERSLENLVRKTSFLYKVSIYMLLYSSIGVLVNILLLFKYQETRVFLQAFYLDKFMPLIILAFVLNKMLAQKKFSFFKKFDKLFVVTDMLCYFLINLQLFYLLDQYYRNMKIYYGHYLFMTNFIIFINIIVYIISIKLSPSRRYNYQIGCILLLCSTIIGEFVLTKVFKSLPHES